jgi:hypothetical protein
MAAKDDLDLLISVMRQHEQGFLRIQEQIEVIHGQIHNLTNLAELPRISRSIENLSSTIGRTMFSLIILLGVVMVLTVWRDADRDLSIDSGGLSITRNGNGAK